MKNIFLIIILILLNNCGYSSVYKNQKTKHLQININEMKGDNEMNNLIKNEINLYSNKDSLNKYDVKIITDFEKKILTKNTSGTITDFQLSVNSIFIISLNNKTESMIFKESINIKKQSDTFEQNNYERNIKRNFASSIRDKFLSEIINIK